MIKESSSTSQKEFVRLDWRLTGKGEIPCQVSDGLFSHERIVGFNFGETYVAFWVSKDLVEVDSELEDRKKIPGFVRVSVSQEKEDSLIVVVSGEPAGNHGTHIEIPKNSIRGVKVPKNLIHPA